MTKSASSRLGLCIFVNPCDKLCNMFTCFIPVYQVYWNINSRRLKKCKDQIYTFWFIFTFHHCLVLITISLEVNLFLTEEASPLFLKSLIWKFRGLVKFDYYAGRTSSESSIFYCYCYFSCLVPSSSDELSHFFYNSIVFFLYTHRN